jgi:TIMELESS-interacting protein
MDPPMDSNDVDLMQEDLLDEIYEKAADVSICPLNFCKRYTSHKLQYSPLYSCLDTGYTLDLGKLLNRIPESLLERDPIKRLQSPWLQKKRARMMLLQARRRSSRTEQAAASGRKLS